MKYGKTKTFAKIADGKPSKNSAGVDFSQTFLYIYPRIATIPATVGIGLWPVRASAVGLINLLVDVVG